MYMSIKHYTDVPCSLMSAVPESHSPLVVGLGPHASHGLVPGLSIPREVLPWPVRPRQWFLGPTLHVQRSSGRIVHTWGGLEYHSPDMVVQGPIVQEWWLKDFTVQIWWSTISQSKIGDSSTVQSTCGGPRQFHFALMIVSNVHVNFVFDLLYNVVHFTLLYCNRLLARFLGSSPGEKYGAHYNQSCFKSSSHEEVYHYRQIGFVQSDLFRLNFSSIYMRENWVSYKTAGFLQK